MREHSQKPEKARTTDDLNRNLHMRAGDRRRICLADGVELAGGCRWTLLTLSFSTAVKLFADASGC